MPTKRRSLSHLGGSSLSSQNATMRDENGPQTKKRRTEPANEDDDDEEPAGVNQEQPENGMPQDPKAAAANQG